MYIYKQTERKTRNHVLIEIILYCKTYNPQINPQINDNSKSTWTPKLGNVFNNDHQDDQDNHG